MAKTAAPSTRLIRRRTRLVQCYGDIRAGRAGRAELATCPLLADLPGISDGPRCGEVLTNGMGWATIGYEQQKWQEFSRRGIIRSVVESTQRQRSAYRIMSFSSIGLALQLIIALVGAFFLAFWVSLVVWTFRDVRARSRDVFAQLLAVLMVIVFNVAGLVLYFMLRPQETLAEQYERALEEEALLQDIEERYNCPGCKHKIRVDFQYCPSCHTRLKQVCPSCGKLIQLQWDMCPYCGAAPSPGLRGVRSAAVGSTVAEPVVRTKASRRSAVERADTIRLTEVSSADAFENVRQPERAQSAFSIGGTVPPEPPGDYEAAPDADADSPEAPR